MAADGERGQSLIVVVAAMFLILVMAALAIDVATWYQKHHQAQVAADAAALAAANCLANASGSGVTCTSETDTADASNVATTYAANNSMTLTSPSEVTVNTTAGNVTVTTASSAPVFFASLLGLTPKVSARAVASYKTGKVPVSLFAGNNSCRAGTGITLSSEDRGGGTTHIDGLWTNGLFKNDMNSSAAHVTGEYTSNSTGSGPYCANDSSTNSGNTSLTSSGTYSSSSSFPNWPAPYSAPTCTASNTKSYWTTSGATNVISGGGVYCASGTASSCSSSTPSGTPGTIYLDAQVSDVEVYASCVIIGSNAVVTAPSGSPAVFATGDSDSVDSVVFATGASVTGAVFAPGWCNTSASPSTLVLAAPDLSACTAGSQVGGTVEVTGNNATSGFIEAENVNVDKNNFTFTGTGPLTVSGTDALIN